MKDIRKFKTDSKLSICMKRLEQKHEQTKNAFKEIFKAVEFPETVTNMCGNVRVAFTETGNAKLHSNYATEEDKLINSCEQISSPLALHRAVSIFETGTVATRQDFYKTNWEVCLLHKPTGKYLMLGEWKGGFQIFTEAYAAKELPKKFVKDAEAFLTWFVSNKVPIGYDGVVAGSVA